MSYRDDREALAARSEQLESELSAAREEIARLRGRGVPANRWLGGPTRIELERTIDGELPESALEELVGVLRSRFGGMGRIERLGGTVSWNSDVNQRGGGRNVAVHFTRREGSTRIRIEESIGRVAGGLFGGIVGGAGGAGAVNLLVWGFILGNVLFFLGAAGWLTLVYGIVRTAYGALSRRRAQDLERLRAELEDAARSAITETKREHVRVVHDENEDENDLAENEVEARREARKR